MDKSDIIWIVVAAGAGLLTLALLAFAWGNFLQIMIEESLWQLTKDWI